MVTHLDWSPRFQLLFRHPIPQVAKRHTAGHHLLERWLTWPPKARTLLGGGDFPVRLIVDINALIDEPRVAVYIRALGGWYVVHVLPVVMHELDDPERPGRTPELRDAAKKADRRLKGLRNNGNVRTGARVAGDEWMVFEHVEPKATGLPSWLDLTVPVDRPAASSLMLRSQHPGHPCY